MENLKNPDGSLCLNESEKIRLQRITKVLNNYYCPEPDSFRKRLEKSDPGTIHVHLLKCEEPFIYIVFAAIGDESDTWIHIDGIMQERESLPENHPVHSIDCLGDIYNTCKGRMEGVNV